MNNYKNELDRLAIYIKTYFDFPFYISFVKEDIKFNKQSISLNIYNFQIGFSSIDKNMITIMEKIINSYLEENQELFVKNKILLKIKYKLESDETLNSCESNAIRNHTNILLGGGGLGKGNNGSYKRTLGLFFQDSKSKKKYGLTCKHGLNLKENLTYTRFNESFKYNIGEIILQSSDILYKKLDYSLIELNTPQDNIFSYSSSLLKIGKIKFNPNICIKINDKALKYGNQTWFTSGEVKSNYCALYNYENGLNLGLIQIQSHFCLFSDKGDSGSIVVNENNEIIGMISFNIGNYIYLVPIQKIIQDLKKNELKINFKLI